MKKLKTGGLLEKGSLKVPGPVGDLRVKRKLRVSKGPNEGEKNHLTLTQRPPE